MTTSRPNDDIEYPKGLHEMLASADVHPLLCAVAHLTGDFTLLRSDLAPDQEQMIVPGRGLSPEQEDEARALAADALTKHATSGHPQHELSPEEMSQIFDFMVGSTSTKEWFDFLVEELALEGTDPRAPSWHFDSTSQPPFSCAIIGAGVSGLAAAYRLRQAGLDVTIFEKNNEVGGTWLENVYPGCRVDVPNQLYSFSFKQSDAWVGRFSAQPDILAYLEQATDDLNLRQLIQFSTEVTEARYDDDTQRWQVEVSDAVGTHTVTHHFDAVISAVGQLNRPSFPDIKGRDTFKGPSFHSAQWDATIDLTNKRVAVIGTGASAVQFVPAVADEAAHVDLYQRTPPWMAPTENYRDPFPPEYHDMLTLIPTFGRWDRLWQFWIMHEALLPGAKVDPTWPDQRYSVSALNDFMRVMLLEILREQVPDEVLFEKMAPKFPPFAKRALRDDGIWAQTVQRDHVELITEPIAEITKKGIRTSDGRDRPADVVIYGTGFTASQFLTPMRIFGQDGVELNEEWDGDARAYLGVTVPRFPNLFMLYGPNTNLVINGSIIVMVECQVRYIVEALGEVLRRGQRTMNCRPDVHETFNEEIDAGNRQMVWGVADVPSWYRNRHGRIAQNFRPFSLLDYWERTRQPDLADYELG